MLARVVAICNEWTPDRPQSIALDPTALTCEIAARGGDQSPRCCVGQVRFVDRLGDAHCQSRNTHLVARTGREKCAPVVVIFVVLRTDIGMKAATV